MENKSIVYNGMNQKASKKLERCKKTPKT